MAIPPPLEVSRMLSPKGPKPWLEAAGQLLPLDHHDYMVDELVLQIALDDVVIRLESDEILTSQSLEHHDLAGFLTRCTEACHNALDKQPNAPLRQDQWYKDLRFTVKTRTGDCSTSLQPPIVGGPGFPVGGDEVLSWDRLGGKPTDGLTLPVEIGASWRRIVSCASDDARRLFCASRMPSFALILAFNRIEKALRILIYHHGGLTASWPCDITQHGGLREIGPLFLTLSSWRTPGDAGFIPSCTNATYALPADQLGENYTLAVVDGVLSWSPCVRGRMTTVSRLHLLRDSPMEGGFSQDWCSSSIPTFPQIGGPSHFLIHNTTKSTTLSPSRSFVREPIQYCQRWTVRLS